MKLGIFCLPPTIKNFFEAVDFAKENGLAGLEPYPIHEFARPDKKAVQAAEALATYARENGIALPCFSIGIDIVSEAKRKENIETLKRYADVAAAMGVPFLHHTILPTLSHTGGKEPFHKLLKRAVAGIREVYDCAASVGVKTVCEDQGFVFNGCERFEMLLSSVDRDIGVVADLGNILFVEEEAASFVGRFAAQIVHVHVKDYLCKSGGMPFPGEEWYETRQGNFLRGTIVGHGVVDFVTVLRILRSAGFQGFYCLEYEGLEEPVSAIQKSIRNFTRYYEDAQTMIYR